MADIKDVHSLRVVDLRDRLKDLGVNHRGRKAELVSLISIRCHHPSCPRHTFMFFLFITMEAASKIN